MRRSLALAHGDEYKLSGRRSFFRRSKKGSHGMSVNHSREGSDSATSITTSCTGKERTSALVFIVMNKITFILKEIWKK